MRNPDYQRDGTTMFLGDCLQVMSEMGPESIDSVVTDPPYGISFMSRNWDHGVPSVEYWREILRVTKPGAHLLAFGGSRTFHRLICAIEDAGFEIRDCIMWVYGSGMPKGQDIGKAIDKELGESRERIRGVRSGVVASVFAQDSWSQEFKDSVLSSEAITDEAKQWTGWHSSLKPAWEPIIVARKPVQGTIATNVLRYGTGALNVDESRVPVTDSQYAKNASGGRGHSQNRNREMEFKSTAGSSNAIGRFPANLIHDGSDEVLALFPETTSGGGPWAGTPRSKVNTYSEPTISNSAPYGINSGSAARFFYCAKASKSDRGDDNKHPTVKPNSLMRYLLKLVTPPNGIVLDPFFGSGSTGKAAITEGFRCIGIEKEQDSFGAAVRRIEAISNELSNPPKDPQMLLF